MFAVAMLIVVGCCSVREKSLGAVLDTSRNNLEGAEATVFGKEGVQKVLARL